jgi:precorrin-8X/cobalt-precorrin-8 methylmutase
MEKNVFSLEEPPLRDGMEIERRSLEIIETEAHGYPRFHTFNSEQQAIIKRQIHATTCFETILDNIWFSPHAVSKLTSLLKNHATIIVDTNMIKTGLSRHYTTAHDNRVVCYVNEPRMHAHAQKHGVTRSYMAVKTAIQENPTSPLILACGNAPTFLYAAVKTLLESNRNTENVAFLAFPVGFVNVIEGKTYVKAYMHDSTIEGIILQGRYGGSTLVVSALHALYRLMA